jgi:LacI family transcriptional regulator
VTIHDVAAAAGVSSATASRVVNGVPTVDPELARRVYEAIEASGYVLNPTARALRRSVTSSWRVIIPDLQNPFFIAVVSSLEEAAGRHGYSIVLSNSDERLDREREAIEAAVAERVAGVVLAVVSEIKSDISPLTRAGIPVVLVDRRTKAFDGDAVFVDNRLTGVIAAQHLIQRGRRRLACIAGRVDVTATEDRLSGFRETLEAAGIGLPDEYVCRSDRRVESGQESLQSLMSLPQPPDALYVTNEPLTAGVFQAAQQLGIAIPEDLALVGTDDNAWMRMVRPQVTTVLQPAKRIGWLAGEMIAARASGGTVAGGLVTLMPTLEARESS